LNAVSEIGGEDVSTSMTAMPKIFENSPSPPPKTPHLARNVPVIANFWMRLLPRSATKTFPLASTAIPDRSGIGTGRPRCLGRPHLVTKAPVFVNT